jgi:thioredoxin-like negative regulator of GroEL
MSEERSLDALIAQEQAVLVLFGAPTCRVCGDIKPHLFAAVSEAYPSIKVHYVDCNEQVKTCAQRGVFSLPVVQVYLEGQKFLEKVRVFSIGQVIDELARPMQLLQGE